MIVTQQTSVWDFQSSQHQWKCHNVPDQHQRHNVTAQDQGYSVTCSECFSAAEDNLSGSIVLTQYIQTGEPRVDKSPPATRKVYWGRNKPSVEYFFLPFLTKTKREQPLASHVYCEIWPPILVLKL